MRKVSLPILATISVVVLSACGGIGGFTQPSGIFPYAGIITEVTAGSQLLDNGATASKEGKACGTTLLGVIATGDTTVETAMKNGGVKKAVYVTHSVRMFLWGIYGEVCTIARGN